MTGLPVDIGEALLIILVVYLLGFIMGRWTGKGEK
jgi:hypothetical protein